MTTTLTILLRQAAYLCCVLWLLSACSEQEPVLNPPLPEPEHQHLVNAELLQSLTREQIMTLTSASKDFNKFKDWIQQGMDIYRITYRTMYQDQTVEASGLLCVPLEQASDTPLLVALHGTILNNEEAPSNTDGKSTRTGLELFASMGFITVVPDYIGFGASKHIFHPYYDYLHTGRTTHDMLLAARELLKNNDIPFTPELYITGYSEGGYASVATLKYLEKNKADFDIRATAAGAGGYNIQWMLDEILETGVYKSPSYLIYMIYAYNITNGWDRPLTDFFQEPYASKILTYATQEVKASQINQEMPKEIDQLFNATFLEGLKDGSEAAFLAAVEQNSVHNWAPQSALRLYHEQDDEVVPIANSEATYEKMLSMGALHTIFFPYDDATSHRSGTIPMYKMAIPWFTSLKNGKQ